MKKPRYKEFDAMVEPVIVYNKVRVVTVHPDREEITSLLSAKELRELADYLDSLSTFASQKEHNNDFKAHKSSPKPCPLSNRSMKSNRNHGMLSKKYEDR